MIYDGPEGGTSLSTSLSVFVGTQGLPLSVDDFDAFSGSAVGTAGPLDENIWHSIALSAAGRESVSKTGTSKFALREYHDANDVEPTDTFNAIIISTSNSIYKPYLDIEVQQGGTGTLSIPVAMHHYNLLRSA